MTGAENTQFRVPERKANVLLPIPLELLLLTGVMEIPLRDLLEDMLKELMTFGPEEWPGDFPLIFMGGGTKTVLTWTGLTGGEGRDDTDVGRKVENCLGVLALAGGTWTGGLGRRCLRELDMLGMAGVGMFNSPEF